MPISQERAMMMQRRRLTEIGGFHKTVHIEQVIYAAGNSAYRPGESTLVSSVQACPTPIVRLVSEEDISELGENVALEDLAFELAGDSIAEDYIRKATQIVLNKGQSDEEFMQVQQVRPGTWIGSSFSNRELAIIGGVVQRWIIYARATKKAA